MTEPTSFETDILPFFTQRDIQAMSKAFNLASYDDVKAHSAAIYDRIRPWPQSRIDLFGKWLADGCPP